MDDQLSRRLSRREFVCIMAACGAGLAGGAQVADRKNGAMTLGFGLYGAKGVKLVEFLPKLATLGFDSVELCLLPGWGCEPAQFTPQRRRELARLLDGAGLKLTSLMEQVDLGGDDAAQRSVRERLARAAELGRALAPQSPSDVCCEVSGMVSGKPGYDPLEAARICYRKMALAMKQAGITRKSA